MDSYCWMNLNYQKLRAGNGWWANKFGIQIGAKYIDAFGIKNLDLQLEHNRVRPFTYSHFDSVANYTHYNQPLAHPLMANFQEVIGIARYQPAPKWLIEAKAIFYQQGRDSSAESYGSNIFLPNMPPYRQQRLWIMISEAAGRQMLCMLPCLFLMNGRRIFSWNCLA